MWGVIGCLFGRNIRCLLVFYGLYSYLPQVVADNGQEVGSELGEQFCKTKCVASKVSWIMANCDLSNTDVKGLKFLL